MTVSLYCRVSNQNHNGCTHEKRLLSVSLWSFSFSKRTICYFSQNGSAQPGNTAAVNVFISLFNICNSKFTCYQASFFLFFNETICTLGYIVVRSRLKTQSASHLMAASQASYNFHSFLFTVSVPCCNNYSFGLTNEGKQIKHHLQFSLYFFYLMMYNNFKQMSQKLQ